MLNKPFLEKNLSYKLRGIFFKIFNEHGYLYKEKAYQNLIRYELENILIGYFLNPKIPLYHSQSGKFISNYFPDFLIENKIILEIKAVTQIQDTHINQLIRYLNCSVYEIGFLINFGSPRLQIIRRIYTNDRKPFLINADLSQIVHR